MSIDGETLKRWYAGAEIPGVLFGLNDSVLVPPGSIEADGASIISLESIAPDVTYLVERTNGEDAIVRQEQLALILYMPMLDEGTDVWRPVAARRLGQSIAHILSKCPEDERWQFPTGARVQFEEQKLSGGSRLVAIRTAGDAA